MFIRAEWDWLVELAGGDEDLVEAVVTNLMRYGWEPQPNIVANILIRQLASQKGENHAK